MKEIRDNYAPETLPSLPEGALPSRSTNEYERLNQGYPASWFQIIEEHEEIGIFTIPQMLSLGVLWVDVVRDRETGKVIDIHLVKIIKQDGPKDTTVFEP